jgi:hypothetical protein
MATIPCVGYPDRVIGYPPVADAAANTGHTEAPFQAAICPPDPNQRRR